MTERVENFMARLSKMPKATNVEAYDSLKTKLENFNTVLPLLEQLSKDSIKPRHWTELMTITSSTFQLDDDFRLKTLLACKLKRLTKTSKNCVTVLTNSLRSSKDRRNQW